MKKGLDTMHEKFVQWLTAHGSRLNYTLSHCSISQFLKHIALAVILCTLSFSTNYAEATAVDYIDASGAMQTCASPTPVTANDIVWGTDGSTTWYVVDSNVNLTGGDSSHAAITLGGDVNLILVDGCKMTVTTTENEGNFAIYSEGHSLHIYGQSQGTGELDAQIQSADYVIGIAGNNVTLGIHGGVVKATVKGTEDSLIGLGVVRETEGDSIIIDGGKVTASGNNGTGIYCRGGNFKITGGQVNATGSKAGLSIRDFEYDTPIPGALILGCNSGSDFISFSSIYNYYDDQSATGDVKIVDGQTLIDSTNFYSGTLTQEQITTLTNKTLKRAYQVSTSDTNITISPEYARYGDIVTLSYTREIPAGYEFACFKVNGTAIEGDKLTMPANNVTVTAELRAITYTISYDLDGGTLTAANPESYTVASENISLLAPEKENCTFTGWTGTGLNALSANVTIPKGSTGDRKYYANWRRNGFTPDDSGKPEFAYHSLILSGQIGVMFYVYIPEAITPSECTMDFNVSGDVSQNNPGQQFAEIKEINGMTFYGYKCRINSVQMADKIHAVLNYSAGSVSRNYSAKEYLDGLVIDTTYSADVIALGRAMKNYGCYVQPVLAQENNWQIGVKHAKMDSADNYTEADFEEVRGKVAGHLISRDIEGTGISSAPYTLYLNSETTIEVKLIPEEGHSISSVKCNGKDAGALQQDGTYKIEIGSLSAHKLADIYTITGSAGEDKNFTVKVSALSYVQGALNDDTSSDEMKCAVTSLYKYYEATKTYRDNRPGEYN